MPGFVFVACLVCIDSEYVKLEKRSDNFLIINCHLVGEQFLSMLKMQNIDMHEISIGNMDIIRSATFSIPPQLFKHCVDVGNQCDKN